MLKNWKKESGTSMKKKLVYLALALSFVLSGYLGQTTEKAAPEQVKVYDVKKVHSANTIERNATEASSLEAAHWSYEGETGPEHWGELDAKYSACGNGSEQSPINIESSHVKTKKKLEGIKIQYEPTAFSLINNGHTVQANAKTDHNSIAVEGTEYKLAQMHFHTPSEHQLNGKNYDMELHLVHKAENGKTAVLGVLIKEGKENEKLAPIWSVLPKEETEQEIAVKEPVDLPALLPKNQTSFYYEGSLTTPPCTEGVEWIVLQQPIEMSKEQIGAFKEIFPDNHRPVQPINKREIIRN